MAIELKFSKPDSASIWGFRLVGGVDFEQLLVVVKVNENSFAEAAGLQLGDIIVRINDKPTAGLTHTQAHDLIVSAGLEFVVGVRRGHFTDLPSFISDKLSNAEVCCILSEETEKSRMLQKTPEQIENLTRQETNISTSSSTYNPIRGSKQKYSTFLQKPEHPKPVPKKLQEERKIIGEPYKVKIIKQKRKFPHEKKVKFDAEVVEVEAPCESEDSSVQGNESYLEESEICEETLNESVIIEEIEENAKMVDEEPISLSTAEQDDNEEQSSKSESPLITEPKPIDIRLEPIPESSMSLEDQLAAVQKQLLALSQLPSAIQTTLEAVTQQLNKIVGAKKGNSEERPTKEEEESITEEPSNLNDEDYIENDVISEKSGEISDNEEETSSVSEGAKKNNTEDEEVQSDTEATLKEDEDDKNETDEEREAEQEIKLTEEEILAKIREQELLEKKQKMEELRKAKDWTSRPIILPGGKKWSDPEDAVPRPSRTVKMSDEKICATIETYSEVIVGKTKGINFLKYTPPPKNLDYLQNSDVYRMVHDLEGPPKGIGGRAEKSLSEQDYYQDKGAP